MKSTALNILFWNAQSLRPKLPAFDSLLIQEKVHIACINETWLEPESPLHIRNFNIFRCDRDDSYGGVAVCTHQSVKCKELRVSLTNPNIEIIHLKLYNCGDVADLICIYCPPSVQTSIRDWEQIFSLAKGKSVIVGDFNAHHTNWSLKTDSKGSQIFDALSDTHLITINDGTPTRVRLVNGVLQQYSPDIAIVSSNIAINFKFQVLNETLGSDHRVMKISTIVGTEIPSISKRQFKKANWESYKNLLDSLFCNYKFNNDIQSDYDQFVDFMNIAAELHIPNTKINRNLTSKFSPRHYWNENISKIVAERRLALSKFRRNPTPQNFDLLKEKIHLAQYHIRKSRNESWRNFCNSLNQSSTLSDVYNKMRWIKGRKSPANVVDKDKLIELLHSLTPDSVSPQSPVFISQNKNLDSPISPSELENAIGIRDTSPGNDNISYSMIRNLPDNGKFILLQLFNEFYEHGFVPHQWRDISMVAIPKSGRDINNVSSLRPISMMSCLCKVFHKILNNRLEWYCEKNNIFSNFTTGFRKTRSTHYNLASLVNEVLVGFSNKKATLACFIDIKGAYNNVDISSLLCTLDRLGAGSKLCSYLWNFLEKRNLKIQSQDSIMSRCTNRGLAQGDPLSPLLFNIATINICKSLTNLKISQYADDFVLYTTCNNVDEGKNILQCSLTNFNDMLSKLGLDISTSKTKLCLFCRGFRRLYNENNEPVIEVKINEQSLEVVYNIKYLGVWLDQSLRWTKHINEICEKTMKLVNVFKILVGPGWGIHPSHLRRLYISLVRSRLDYASFFYDNCSKTSLAKIDRIQNMCMRLIGGFIKSTPIHVMESELNIPPLFIRRHFLAAKFWLKCSSVKNNEIIDLLHTLELLCSQRYWQHKKLPLLVLVHKYLNSKPIYKSKQLEMFSLDTWTSNVDLSCINCNLECMETSKRKSNIHILKKNCNQFIEQNYYNFYKIYTDGSKDAHGVGAAFLDPQVNEKVQFQLSSGVSSMFAELVAISEALSYLNSLNFDNYVILSDCRSALQHLARCNSTFRGLPLAYTIIDSIRQLKCQKKNIVLQWIPAHIGLVDNERVDLLAKQATVDGIPYDCLPHFTDLFFIPKQKCKQMWHEYFDERSYTKGIWYKTIQPVVPYNSWVDVTNMSRCDVVLALRLRSGHTPCNSFAYLMGKSNSPNCLQCGVVEDTFHILMECVRNATERQLFFKNYSYNNFDVGVCNSILAIPDSESAKQLYKIVNLGISRKTTNM